MYSLWLIESGLCVRRSVTISDTDLAPLTIDCSHFCVPSFPGWCHFPAYSRHFFFLILLDSFKLAFS